MAWYSVHRTRLTSLLAVASLVVCSLIFFQDGGHAAPAGAQALHKRDDDGNDDLSKYEILVSGSGSARTEEGSSSDSNLPSVSVPRKEKYPVDDTHKLPDGKAEKLRKVQSDKLKDDLDKKRRQVIKDAFLVSWNQYKENAWGDDEIKPVSNKSDNPFLGWAATLVDSLDTLQIMGLDDEFEKAVDHVKKIDFTATFRQDIPLFETVIRYLGGLVSAYDLSDHKETVLLEQAKSLADNLIGAFDTPNRMPSTFFRWQDNSTESLRYLSGTDIIAAELGTLTLEFGRLAQLTKNDSYYDAVDRITDQFIKFKENSPIPGLLPLNLDASGCNVTYTDEDEKEADDLVSLGDITKSDKEKRDDDELQKVLVPQDGGDDNDPTSKKYRKGHCKEKDLDVAANTDTINYMFGGGVDSVYEYYVKTYQLLNGKEDKYKKLYTDIVEPAKENILFKPKVKNNDGVLLLGSQEIQKNDTSSKKPVYAMQHLTCFAGGMFGLASKLFDRPDDLDIAERVTKGCVWAYNATQTGVMAESFEVRSCDVGKDWDAECKFDEEKDGGGDQEKRDDSSSSEDDESSSPQDMPSDFVSMTPKYYLRPEALESVFYMYRITGDDKWREYGWNMIQSILKLTAVHEGDKVVAYSGVADVTNTSGRKDNFDDVEESFWMAETLKYAYLLFDDSETISLDDYVFNTEAHPLKLN